MTAETPSEAPRRPSRVRRFARWAVPLVLVPALAAGAVTVSSGSPAGHPDRARFAPLEPGTTWVYRETTNGEPTGLAFVTVVGRTIFSTGDVTTPAVMVRRDYEDFIGRGPATNLTYLSVTGSRVESLGTRYGSGDLVANVPPEPTFQAPYLPGRSWSWSGTAGDEAQRAEVSVEETGAVEVAGQTIDGCMRQTGSITFADDTSETSESWICPGLGLVSAHIEAPGVGVVLDEELVAFAGPDRSVGSVPGGEGAAPAAGGGPGMGPDRANAVDGSLDLDGLAWSDTRNQVSVFPPAGDDTRLVIAEQDGFVSLTDLTTGEVRWRIRLRDPIVVPPVLAGDLVLAADASKTLVAIDAERGHVRWSAGFDDLVSSAPAVLGSSVVVTTEDREVHALSLDGGAERWTADTGSIVLAPPVVAGDRVVVADEDGGLAAYREDGSSQWTASLEEGVDGPPAASAESLIVADLNGGLLARDLATGEERWQLLLPGYRVAVGGPAVRERIVVLSENTRSESFLTAYGLDGEELWDRRVPGEHDVGPVIVGEQVVALSEDGTLRVYALADGTEAGERRLRSLDGSASASAVDAVGYAGGALVAALHTGPPWGSVTYLGIPVDAAATGAAFAGEVWTIGDTWRSASTLGDRVVYTDFSGGVLSAAPDAAPVSLADGEAAAYAVPAGDDTVLAHVDDEALALDATGGDVRWRFDAGGARFGTFAAAGERTAYLPVTDEGLAAVDLASGRTRWVFQAVGAGITGPLVLPDGDAVYTMGGMARIDESTGRPVWRGPAVETFGPMATDGDAVAVIGLTDTSSELIVVEAGTGEVRWRVEVAAAALIGPALEAGVAVAVDEGGLARGFDAATGEELWAFRMRTTPCGTPVLHQGRVLLAERGRLEDLTDRDYRVTALDARTGRFVAAIEPLGTSGVIGDCASAGDGRLLIPGSLQAQLLELSP